MGVIPNRRFTDWRRPAGFLCGVYGIFHVAVCCYGNSNNRRGSGVGKESYLPLRCSHFGLVRIYFAPPYAHTASKKIK